MSYSIFYRAMYIKMRNDEYIPLIESGDNNVWDVDRNRRSREWTSCRWLHESDEQRARYSLTEKEILDAAQKEIDKTLERNVGKEPAFGGPLYTKEDVLKDLGFFNGIKVNGNSTTSAASFYNFMKSGIRHAIRMDEMRCGLRLSWYELTEDGKSSRWCTDYACNEEELSQKWEMYRNKGITPWIGLSEASAEYEWEAMKMKTQKPKAARKTPTEYFIIAFTYCSTERFVVKLTSSNLKFNPFRDRAYRYSSRKLAENAGERIARRFNQVSNIRVESILA